MSRGAGLHPILQRYFRKSGLEVDVPPESADGWGAFVQWLSKTLDQHDDDRYTLERSLDVVSEEMKELYDSLRASSESMLAKERDLLRAVTQSVGDGLCAVDQEGKIVFVNPECERLLGAPEEQLVGMSSLDFVGGRIASLSFEKLMRGDACRGDDGLVRRVDGQVFPASYVLTPVTDNGAFVGAVNVFRDITVQKRVSAELSEARDHALAASRMKSEFVANMSHELRTPLNGIIGMVELLVGSRLSNKQSRFVRTIRACSQTLLSLISDVLDFSKIEAGRLEIERLPFDLRQITQEVMATVAPRAETKGIELAVSIDETVPAHVEGDPHRIRQILLNLVANGIKFTDAGRVDIAVRARARGDGALDVLFSVRDTGVGIEPERQSVIFEAFRQADGSTTREFGGTGLGLSICRKLVDLMGGRIGVRSMPARGSNFWFSVPMVAVEGAVVEHSTNTRADETAVRGAREQRVLIAEDNDLNSELVVEILENAGFSVETAFNGEEACALATSESFDAILMDCQMPVLDGYQATLRIRSAEEGEQYTPIIALTANALNGDRERCIAAGMDDYVSKPFMPADLVAVVEKWCANATGSEQEDPADRRG